MKQEDRILRHLKDNKSITSWEAITEYGITRISAVIFRLRKQGYKINGETIFTLNRYGENTHYTNYILEDK